MRHHRFATLARCCAAAAALLCCGSASAHEFWMQAASPAAAGQGSVLLQLFVGEALQGDRVAWTRQHAAAFRLHSASGVRDLLPLVPAAGTEGDLRLRLPPEGVHVLAYESHPSEVTLDAVKFHEYLAQEGLSAIVRQRMAAGTASTPGRERFRRSAKLLLRVSGTGAAALRPTGQRMEVLPLDDPFAARPGAGLRFAVRYEGKPLPGVLLKGFHRQGAAAEQVQGVTDARGVVTLKLPRPGFWLLNAVHMVALPPGGAQDWDSFWGSLGFELGP
jgi:uncharacterized GH25 family protein